MYDPKVTCYPFPEQTDQHYLIVKKNDGTVFDKNYPYVDESKKMKFKQALLRIPLVLIAFPVCHIRQGLIIRGRKNLRKHRDLLKQGVVSVANHVNMWDYIAVMKAVCPFRTGIIAWAKNVSGENGKLIRLVGGIPVPENDVRATGAFSNAILKYLRDGHWLHVCAEGSMWEFYQPIRPFKKGAFYFAVKTGKPVLPMAFSYRETPWLLKWIYRKGLLTLTIGEPIFSNPDLPSAEAVEDITIRAHEAVCRLAGIDPKENLYPPLFDNSKRIDYYTTEYGKKKK